MKNESPDLDIEVNALTVSYEEKSVLENVSLGIHRGQVTCILGPSGCGKSTLLKAMLGRLRPIGGRIRILGRDILNTEREELSKFLVNVGVTFQHGALFGSQSVGENVAAPLHEHTDLDAESIRMLVRVKLALVGMEGAIDRMPSQLSGGMQKRVAIARALALDPKILFFDEPSAGLDPITALALDDLILFLNRSLGCTIVVITHEIRSVLRISSRIVCLGEGKVLLSGTVHEFLTSPKPEIKAFLAASRAGADGTHPHDGVAAHGHA